MKKRNQIVTTAAIIVAIAVATSAFILFSAASSGTLTLEVTDAPVAGVSHIYLTISGIELQGSGNTTSSFSSSSRQFDLLALVNVTQILGVSKLPTGNYSMIRFDVSSAVATIGGTNVTLAVPSGQVKVPISLQIKSGATTTVVLDITADMTNISASYNLRPVVTVKSITGP